MKTVSAAAALLALAPLLTQAVTTGLLIPL